VLNIHCSVGSALRVTSCHLIRADNDSFHPHHSHLDSCSLSQHQPSTAASREYQPTESHNPPITELVAESHDLPITELLAESHNPPITELVAESHDLPITELLAESHNPPVTELVAESHDLPITELLAESHNPPVTELLAESHDQPITELVAESHNPPVTELVAESHDLPITELLAESHDHDPPITSVDNRLHDAEQVLVSVEPRRVQSTQVDWFCLDRAVIGQLNDVLWTDSCLTALRQLMNIHQFPRRQQLIISSPTPLMFPFAALRLGLVSDLCFLDLDPVHRPLIGRLLAANEVGGEEAHVTYGCPWQRDVSAVLFADIVSSEGCMRQNMFDQLYATR